MSNALEVQLLTEHAQLKSGQSNTLHALIRLEALGRPDLKRAPLDLIACIDVSGSMGGPKLAAVKQALRALGAELGANDRLGVTSFASEVRQVLRPTAMHAEGKAQLRRAVDGLEDKDSTNMSGGLVGALADLRAAPLSDAGAICRVLLFTDGHANKGVAENDRAGWTALLREHLGELSVSWFGFGEDHDADFLAWLADQSRGNAYVTRDADAIADAFARELGGLLGARASDLQLELSAPAVELCLLNDERSERRGERLTISLDDLSCEERKDLVVALTVGPDAAPVSLQLLARWRDTLTGALQSTEVAARVSFSTGGPDAPRVEVQEAVALVLAANAQRRARDFAEQGRWEDAARVMLEATLRLEGLGTERGRAFASHMRGLIPEYGEAARYRRGKMKLKSNERAMSKQRSSGSDVDGFFDTSRQREQQARFKAKPPPGTRR